MEGNSELGISQKETASSRFLRENLFGGGVLGYSQLDEVGKRGLWVEEGGRGFVGEFGEVRRYIVGVTQESEEEILKQGFNPKYKRPGGVRGLFHKIIATSSREGTGVYCTTNPWTAIGQYGGMGIVVDVALGKEITVDNNRALSVIEKIKRPFELAVEVAAIAPGMATWIVGQVPDRALSFVSLSFILAYSQLKKSFLDEVYKSAEADTIKLSPNIFPALWSSLKEAKKHINPRLFTTREDDHWLLVRDSARIKIVGSIHSPEEASLYKT